MLLAALALAAACTGWHGQATGFYRGTVESIGPKPIDTWITETPQGLAGRYVLHEPDRDVEGTLEPLGDADCEVALFRWTDLYGTGIARLRFYPASYCFEGAWGREQVSPALTWHSCTRTPVTS